MTSLVSDSKPTKALTIKKPKRVTPKTLAKFVQRALVDVSPQILEEFWSAVHDGLKARDPVIIKEVARIYNYVQSGGGVNVNVQQTTLQQQAGDGKDKGYEHLIRLLESRDREREHKREEVIDAEFTEKP